MDVPFWPVESKRLRRPAVDLNDRAMREPSNLEAESLAARSCTDLKGRQSSHGPMRAQRVNFRPALLVGRGQKLRHNGDATNCPGRLAACGSSVNSAWSLHPATSEETCKRNSKDLWIATAGERDRERLLAVADTSDFPGPILQRVGENCPVRSVPRSPAEPCFARSDDSANGGKGGMELPTRDQSRRIRMWRGRIPAHARTSCQRSATATTTLASD